MGIGVTTPRAGLDVNHDNGLLATGTFATGTIPLEGPGTRLMWYPAKGAFRAGTVGSYADPDTGVLLGPTFWDDVNIGLQSTAFGYTCRATGDYRLQLYHRLRLHRCGPVRAGHRRKQLGHGRSLGGLGLPR